MNEWMGTDMTTVLPDPPGSTDEAKVAHVWPCLLASTTCVPLKRTIRLYTSVCTRSNPLELMMYSDGSNCECDVLHPTCTSAQCALTFSAWAKSAKQLPRPDSPWCWSRSFWIKFVSSQIKFVILLEMFHPNILFWRVTNPSCVVTKMVNYGYIVEPLRQAKHCFKIYEDFNNPE